VRVERIECATKSDDIAGVTLVPDATRHDA